MAYLMAGTLHGRLISKTKQQTHIFKSLRPAPMRAEWPETRHYVQLFHYPRLSGDSWFG
jgi:hypothetical protein